MPDLEPGQEIPELSVTPDRYLTVRYAGASGDFNPIHIDDDFARSVGLPGRILHGLWTMAQVARAATAVADGDPQALARLQVEFRGMGVPERELTVTGTVEDVADDLTHVVLQAEQEGNTIVPSARAELRTG
ncbi:MaoC/PaaZ C-terminal domain-containing protein [Paraconexibacter sp.]|uniref:MaoC/PaaZ C-terminal domain-containing protein n=1 Tax=Paraconexibacter sp. TaxID=2949640 RepID=UPI0035651914